MHASTTRPAAGGTFDLRFILFLIVLAVLMLIVLYVMGDRRQPAQRIIEQEVVLQPKEGE